MVLGNPKGSAVCSEKHSGGRALAGIALGYEAPRTRPGLAARGCRRRGSGAARVRRCARGVTQPCGNDRSIHGTSSLRTGPASHCCSQPGNPILTGAEGDLGNAILHAVISEKCHK
jgi:hypothetical protein